MISTILVLAAFLFLVVQALRDLRAAGYSLNVSVALVVLFSLQLAAGFSANASRALMLAFAIFIVAKAALEFSAAQNARRVIVLGLSLAAVQIASPAGLMVSAIAAPPLAAAHGPVPSRGKNVGLLLLTLFPPLMSAMIFAYFAREFQFDLWAHMAGPFDHLFRPQKFDPLNAQRNALINIIALGAAAFPVWGMVWWSRRARIVAVIVSALLAAVAVAAVMERPYSFGTFVPALGSLSFLMIVDIARGPLRACHAIAMVSASVAVSWLLLEVPL